MSCPDGFVTVNAEMVGAVVSTITVSDSLLAPLFPNASVAAPSVAV